MQIQPVTILVLRKKLTDYYGETEEADGQLRVIRVLERLKEECGQPQKIRVDNGPKLISVNLLDDCEYHDITLCHIQPGKPLQKKRLRYRS